MRIFAYLDTTPPNLIADLGTEVIESHLRLSYTDESDYIDALSAAAVRAVEYEANVEHGAGTVEVYSDCIPADPYPIPVDAHRFTATAVEYLDSDGVWVALDATTYNFTTKGNPLVFSFTGDAYPEDMDVTSTESFRILGTYSAKAMPANIQQAALLMLAHLYQNREAVVNEKVYDLPLAFTYLIGKSRKSPLR